MAGCKSSTNIIRKIISQNGTVLMLKWLEETWSIFNTNSGGIGVVVTVISTTIGLIAWTIRKRLKSRNEGNLGRGGQGGNGSVGGNGTA
ncbi:MAG: hypothetical protein ABGW90_02005, partial [Martelella sp.]